MKMKIVINDCYGGFSLSKLGFLEYCKLKGWENNIGEERFTDDNHVKLNGKNICCSQIERNDPSLIKIVEDLGEKANSSISELKIVEIPNDVKWMIYEENGNEWIAEEHRRWS